MVFTKADILLPVDGTELEKWSVVACDQFTSQPEYWEKAAEIAGDAPSTLNLVYPEAFLSEGDGRIAKINAAMKDYIEKGVFKEYKNALIYVERHLSGNRVRRGLMGAVDLEAYDFNKGSKSAVRATEGTVLERIPPRVKIRQDAPLELPHVMILTDDVEDKILRTVKCGEKVYDFELMLGGGHISGYLVSNVDEVLSVIEEYEKTATDGLAYAVGDGNHSLATAKTCWENLKGNVPENHPARYCLIELENIHDKALEFEPIHRVVFNTEPEKLISEFKVAYGAEETDNGGQRITYVYGDKSGELYIKNPPSKLEVGTLQKFLDEVGCEVDYIHGEDVVKALSSKKDCCGFILPKPGKSDLFASVIADGALPRKTFSMGEANEKRYYMEAKKIK